MSIRRPENTSLSQMCFSRGHKRAEAQGSKVNTCRLSQEDLQQMELHICVKASSVQSGLKGVCLKRKTTLFW